MAGWVTTTSALLAFSLYYNTLDNGFVYDDRRAILSNPDVIGHTPIQALFENDFWGTPLIDPGSHGSYRPLCVATYRLNYAFSGFKPWSYHFLNVIFHCCATVLVVATAGRLLPTHCKNMGTAVAGLTFAAHPIHTEAVAGVVGRADVAACIFFLISFLIYTEHIRLREQSQIRCCRHILKSQLVRKQVTDSDQSFRLSCHGLVQHIVTSVRRLLKAGKKGPMKVFDACEVKTDSTLKLKCQYSASVSENSRISAELLQWFTLAGTLLFAVAATLCKEPGIMVLPLCILYDFLKGFRQEESSSKCRWRSVSALSMGGFALLCWRLRLTGAPSTFAAADNPASRDPSILTRFYTFSYLPVFNFFLLLYPFQLSFDWSMDAIPRITTIFDPRNLSTFIFYAILSRVTWRAMAKEFYIRQEKIKKEKYHKKFALKVNKRCFYNKKQYYKEPYCILKKGYCSPPKESTSSSSRRFMCPCNGCNHPLTEDHTNACRAINNNNIMMHYSHCVCPKYRAQTAHASVYKSSQVALLVSTAFMVLPFVPASNLLFYVGFVVAERVLYIPSVGLCLLLGLGAGTLTHKWHRCESRSKILMCGLLLALAAMCGYTLKRNLDWRDEESLFRSAVDINPPKAYGNLGSVLTAQGRTAEAVVAFEKALMHRPNMADVHYNLGILLQNQRRYGEAIKSFERAIYFRPSMALAYVNMGVSLMADGRMAEAANVLRAGSRADGSRVRDRREHDAARVSALVQLAALHSQVGNWNKALMAYKEALQILPQSNAPLVGWTRHSILSMAGEIYVQLEQWNQAESSILSALSLAPYNVAAHITMAQIIARNASRVSEAEMWFKKAVTIAPNDPSVRDQFGMFLWSQRRLSESADQYVAAAKLDPKDDVRAAAAARALRDSERCSAAEQWYATAAELKPENPEHHSNLGAILHLNGKYDAAISSYYRALQLQPNDAITMTNLKRVRSLKNRHRTNIFPKKELQRLKWVEAVRLERREDDPQKTEKNEFFSRFLRSVGRNLREASHANERYFSSASVELLTKVH